MNTITFAELKERVAHRVRVLTRVLDPNRRTNVFSQLGEADSVPRIYVINLDRKPDRWRRIRRELERFRGRNGEHLTTLTRRISAIDARHLTLPPDLSMIRPYYTLADQLTVDPNPLLKIDDQTRARNIRMTRQEIAVALSHIEAWRRVAHADDGAALILEDDVVITYGFARRLQETWTALQEADSGPTFDLLYLAFKDVCVPQHPKTRSPVRRRDPGIWEAAAYILTKAAAQKLLDRLPAFGPVDLWLNLQFAELRAFTAGRPLIEQRIDEPSTNSYSVLPVLSQVGVITKEKPLLPSSQKLRGPVFGLGELGSGLTSLAAALSMVGYTCLSDVDHVPRSELEMLRRRDDGRQFNAYVNVGWRDNDTVTEIALTYPDSLFILTTPDFKPNRFPGDRVLRLSSTIVDKWEHLSQFLGIDYPTFPYPAMNDVGQRRKAPGFELRNPLPVSDRKFDASPWILARPPLDWQGIQAQSGHISASSPTSFDWSDGEVLDDQTWRRRDDTFPSNLSLFVPKNVIVTGDGIELTLRHESTPVREFTAAAVASRSSFRYGTFSAELRPANISGVITGLFLHRNGPRQEIDIEFLGRDTTKMLVNVFYNPGPEDTKLEYGYRGTPTEISLGFDASADFHLYEIDWRPERIVWKVDGASVYERAHWNPTPIPDCPLEFNVNLWHSRSTELAGKLDQRGLPTHAKIRSISISAEDC